MKLPILLVGTIWAGFINVWADSFRFNTTNLPPDLLVGIRQTSGSQEVLADLGPVSRFYNAIPGTNFTITEVDPAVVLNTFSGLDSVGVSAFAAMTLDSDPAHPFHSVWMTRKRTDLAVQSAPWLNKSAGTLSTPVSRINTLGTGAAAYSAAVSAGANNTATLVVLPASLATGLTAEIGTGTLGGSFQGNIETLTPAGFTGGTGVIRSDLYELDAGASGSASYLGYFEFKPDATLTFTAAGGNVVLPAAQTITFAALPDTTYSTNAIALNASASSGLPVTFAVAGGLATVNGNVLTPTGAGTVTVVASQAGNTSWQPVSATNSFKVLAPAPIITGYGRTNDISTVSFTTVPGAQYTLLGTPSGSLLPTRLGWIIESTVAGTGDILSLTNRDGGPNYPLFFYYIEAKP